MGRPKTLRQSARLMKPRSGLWEGSTSSSVASVPVSPIHYICSHDSDGHIAFNEPGSSLSSRTRIKTLAYETILSNCRFFNDNLALVPRMALTVGVATIMDAKEVVLVVTGTNKAAALSGMLEGGVCHMNSASALQNHPKALVVCE